MMKHLFVPAAILASCSFMFSQESTLTPGNGVPAASGNYIPEPATTQVTGRILIIPFEPRLFMSDVSAEIHKKTGLSFDQIRENFRYGSNNMLYASCRNAGSTVSLLQENEEMRKDLEYIYRSIGYEYRVLPPESEQKRPETGAGKIAEKVRLAMDETAAAFRPKPEEPGTSIREGQLYSVTDNCERYMHTRIIHPAMLHYISSKYQNDYFVFINQLDIHKSANADYRALESENYTRVAKAHYTIMDKSGNEIAGGAAKVGFSSSLNDMNRIIRGHFPDLTQQIADQLPGNDVLPEPGRQAMPEKRNPESVYRKRDQESRDEDY